MAPGKRLLPEHPRPGLAPRPLRPAARPSRQPWTKATRPRRTAPTLAWMLLYALLPLSASLFALSEDVPSSGGMRTLAQGVVVVLVFGLAAVWVHANRRALSRTASDSTVNAGPQEIPVGIHPPSPRVIRLEARRTHRDS